MTTEPIKLADKQENPQQPTFPITQAQVTPQGVIISTHFTPVSVFTTVLTMDMLRQLMPGIKEALKNEQTMLHTIQHVQRSKIN